MNNIPNREVMNRVLVDEAENYKELVVLTSDSRGSAKLNEFGEKYPERMIEVGIAEQNIVGIASGLAHSGKRPFVASPAPFLSMRSIEQIKVDVAYSDTNVKLIGISGGVSYGELGMSHHSLQDFAVTRAIPNLQVLCPADRFETELMFKELLKTNTPAYVRLGRNPVRDSYENVDYKFEIGKAVELRKGTDITIIGIGETVRVALDAAEILENEGVSVNVINTHTLKPFDEEVVLNSIINTKHVVTVEEHSIYGGLGSRVSELLIKQRDVVQEIIGFPDEELVTGSSDELFDYYGLTGINVANKAKKLLG